MPVNTTPQNTATQTFINEANRLVDAGQVSSYKEIAEAIGWDKSSISNVMNGRRNIPIELFKKFCDTYKVTNPNEITYKDKYIQLLERQLSEQNFVINMLKETMSAIQANQANLEKGLANQSAIAAMNLSYQEWTVRHLVGADNADKVLSEIQKKALVKLTTFSEEGIAVDTHTV